ncbi:hypothetical protein [Niallia taxi]|uniref:hypothetical protein n=1 Tax=Niallia taxi TaxID=2499688 RepID=UPI00300819F5
MKIINEGLINEGYTYTVEFTKAEEVAVLGDNARKQTMRLPEGFDIDNEAMMNKVYETAKQVMETKNFDTFVIEKETYQEYLFYAESGE